MYPRCDITQAPSWTYLLSYQSTQWPVVAGRRWSRSRGLPWCARNHKPPSEAVTTYPRLLPWLTLLACCTVSFSQFGLLCNGDINFYLVCTTCRAMTECERSLSFLLDDIQIYYCCRTENFPHAWTPRALSPLQPPADLPQPHHCPRAAAFCSSNTECIVPSPSSARRLHLQPIFLPLIPVSE
jgi:hypothetical protein